MFWVDVSSTENAETGFLRVAELCGITHASSDNVRHWLATVKKPWLLILDNGDDPDVDYRQYMPTSAMGSILLTTRIRDCSTHQTVGSEELKQLDDSTAVRLLLRAANVEESMYDAKEDAAHAVVELLGSHTLAVVHAGAYVRNGLSTLEEYPEIFARRKHQLLKFQPKQAESDYGNIYATFEVSAAKLVASSEPKAKSALDLLGVLAFMHFQGVTESIFERAWNHANGVWRISDQ